MLVGPHTLSSAQSFLIKDAWYLRVCDLTAPALRVSIVYRQAEKYHWSQNITSGKILTTDEESENE